MKTFTLKEANRLLPMVKSVFDDVFVLKKKTAIMKGELGWIVEFWGNDLRDSDNLDAERYDKIVKEMEKINIEAQKKLKSLEMKGCVIKDPNAGLVDFYSILDNNIIFLCWRYGEKEIEYWHPVDSGFGGRRPFNKIDRIE